VRREGNVIIVEKNRKRAFGALALICFMFLVSVVLLVVGLVGKSGVLWTLVWLGLLGLLGFGGSAGLVIHTMCSPWHLAVSPTHLRLHTPTYVVNVPWENVAGIAVDEVNWRDGCTLVFGDPASVAQGTRFLARSTRPDIVTDAVTMLARMEDCYANLGYHLGIPGRLLEKGPAELADLLSKACTGRLWEQAEEQV
jgi:hypothetical protein